MIWNLLLSLPIPSLGHVTGLNNLDSTFAIKKIYKKTFIFTENKHFDN